MLARLLSSRHLPDESWVWITNELKVRFGFLSEATRGSVLRALISAAGSENPELSVNAIVTLYRMTASNIQLGPFLDPDNRKKVIVNYRRLAPPEGFQGDGVREFESQLGIATSTP